MKTLCRLSFTQLLVSIKLYLELSLEKEKLMLIVLSHKHVDIQQEDPNENYAPTLGWSLRLF